MSEITSKTLATIESAIAHARAKHGARCIDRLPLHHRVTVLVEEVGEVARAVQHVEDARQPDDGDDRDEVAHLRAELAQVAAVALMWIEEMEADRG